MRAGLGVKVAACLMACVFLVPTVVVIGTSINGGPLILFPPRQPSMRWYEELFTTPRWTDALQSSLKIAIFSALLAMPIGTLLGLAAARGRRLIPASIITGIALAPMVVPSIVLGVGFYIASVHSGLSGTTLGFVLAHATVGVPFIFVNVLITVGSIDPSVEEAARVSGAGPLTTTVLITLRLIAPAVFVGGVFAFIASWDEVVISSFLASPLLRTLPVEMFSDVRNGATPATSAVAVLVTATTLILLNLLVATSTIRRSRLKKSES